MNTQQSVSKIVLLGYMASGKSAVGKLLAAHLGIPFIDLDSFIEKKQGATVASIFQSQGELAFRKLEHEHLSNLLHSPESMVLSLGGGTPCYYNHMEMLQSNPNVVSIYLKVDLSVLVHRLQQEKAKRPLVAHLNTQEEFANFVGKHLFERANYYRQATFEVPVKEESVSEVLTKITKLLR